MTIDVVSFDLDGTLVDTAAEIATAVNRTLADFSRVPQSQAAIEQLIGAGAHEHIAALLLRPAFGPVHRVAGDGDLAEPQGRARDTVGTERGDPAAVRCNFARGHCEVQ